MTSSERTLLNGRVESCHAVRDVNNAGVAWQRLDAVLAVSGGPPEVGLHPRHHHRWRHPSWGSTLATAALVMASQSTATLGPLKSFVMFNTEHPACDIAEGDLVSSAGQMRHGMTRAPPVSTEVNGARCCPSALAFR